MSTGAPSTRDAVAPNALAKSFRHFAPEIRRQRGWILVATAALFAEVGLRLLEPWPLKYVFDRLLIPRAATLARDGIAAGNAALPVETPPLLVGAVLAVLAIAGLRALAAYGSTVGFAIVGNRVLSNVRARLFRQLQFLPLGFHDRARTGDLVVRVTGDIGVLQDTAVTAFLPLIARVFVLAGMVATMFWMNWRLATLAVALLPFFLVRTRRLAGEMRGVARKQRKREGAMAATAAESFAAAHAVRSLSLESRFAESFASANERSQKADVRGKRLAAALERSVDVFIAAAGAVVLGFGARFVLAGTLTPGDLLVFLAYLKTAFRPLQDFAKYTTRLGKAAAAAERIHEILETTPDVVDRPDAVPAPRLRGDVSFRGVSFGYDAAHAHLHDVSFEVPAGARVAVVGASGSGKSTLLRLILRLVEPRSGVVRFDGRDVREFTVESVRRQIGVVLQDTALFAGTVRDNIALGVAHATDEAIEAAARLAQAHEFVVRLPRGYDTEIGERGVALSQGQRQRLAIARAALRDTPLLLLDEPVTGLDPLNAAALAEALAGLGAGRTVFWITHDLAEARGADLVLHLHDGRLVEAGTHAELIRKGGRYAELVRRTSRSERNDHAFHA